MVLGWTEVASTQSFADLPKFNQHESFVIVHSNVQCIIGQLGLGRLRHTRCVLFKVMNAVHNSKFCLLSTCGIFHQIHKLVVNKVLLSFDRLPAWLSSQTSSTSCDSCHISAAFTEVLSLLRWGLRQYENYCLRHGVSKWLSCIHTRNICTLLLCGNISCYFLYFITLLPNLQIQTKSANLQKWQF